MNFMYKSSDFSKWIRCLNKKLTHYPAKEFFFEFHDKNLCIILTCTIQMAKKHFTIFIYFRVLSGTFAANGLNIYLIDTHFYLFNIFIRNCRFQIEFWDSSKMFTEEALKDAHILHNFLNEFYVIFYIWQVIK